MAKKSKPHAHLVGDGALVGELGRVCHDAGIETTCSVNVKTDAGKIPKSLTMKATVPRSATICFELTNTDIDRKKKNLRILDSGTSNGTILCSSSVVVTASEQSTWILHPRRLIGMSALPTLLTQSLIELAPTVSTDQSAVEHATGFLTSIGKESVIVQDRVGMVMPRILATLVNEAAFALGENIASPGDVDAAMKLGMNYPFGPIEWGDHVGFDQILRILNALFEDLHEERYRAAPLLKRLATGAKWWGS